MTKCELCEPNESKRHELLAQRSIREWTERALTAEAEELRADLASIRSVYDFAALESKIAELRAENHDLRSSIITDLGPKLADLRAALKPFAALAPHYPMAQKYGNRPRSGDIHNVSSGGMPDASITVENVHMAAAALGNEQAPRQIEVECMRCGAKATFGGCCSECGKPTDE